MNRFEWLEGDNLNINVISFLKMTSGTYIQLRLAFKRSLWEHLTAKLSYIFLVGVCFLQKQQTPWFPGTQIFKPLILARYELFLITLSDRIFFLWRNRLGPEGEQGHTVQMRGCDSFLEMVWWSAQPWRFGHWFQQVTGSHTALVLVWENKAVGRKQKTWEQAEG